MKMFISFTKILLFLPFLFCCSNESEGNQEDDLKELNSLKKEIDQLVATSSCIENSNCDYLAFGSKPCGGPWSYIVFSKSVNVDLLKEKVAIYYVKESAYNKKWNIVSDCAFAMPPTALSCVDGKCVAVY